MIIVQAVTPMAEDIPGVEAPTVTLLPEPVTLGSQLRVVPSAVDFTSSESEDPS